MSIVKTAKAHYQPLGKSGQGKVSLGSGVLSDQPYGFNTRFEGKTGTNPEELVAGAHASCFAMALSFALGDAGYTEGELYVEGAISLDKDGEGFSVTKSELVLDAKVSGIDESKFEKIAGEAKNGCPISKLLNCEVTLAYTLHS